MSHAVPLTRSSARLSTGHPSSSSIASSPTTPSRRSSYAGSAARLIAGFLRRTPRLPVQRLEHLRLPRPVDDRHVERRPERVEPAPELMRPFPTVLSGIECRILQLAADSGDLALEGLDTRLGL